jgi:hypothetical protein
MLTWTILVATLGRRGAKLSRLMDALAPQLAAADGTVSVEALWNHGERPLGQVRQDLLAYATAEYVCFIDDDDMVPPNYVEAILPLLDGVDYVGFNVLAVTGGEAGVVGRHGLQGDDWSEGPGAYHLNPLRRELAARGSFPASSDYNEDRIWSLQVRPHVQTGHYLDEVMYLYSPACELNSRITDAGGGPCGGVINPPKQVESGVFARPVIASPHFTWHPASSPEGPAHPGILL